jgi:hypothetical protein
VTPSDDNARQGSADDSSPAHRASSLTRFDALTARTARDAAASWLPDALCRAAVAVLPMDSIALSVYLGEDVAVPMGVSDTDAATAEQLQFTLGEGPCYRSYEVKNAVLVPDIDGADSFRWPFYATELTRRTSFHAVFAFPLMPHGVPVGSVSMYRRSPGALADFGEARLIAERIAVRLLNAGLFGDYADDGHHGWLNKPTVVRRHQVSMAQGITMQVNRINPSEALALLRSYAFSLDRLLDDVAPDIIEGRLPAPTIKVDR